MKTKTMRKTSWASVGLGQMGVLALAAFTLTFLTAAVASVAPAPPPAASSAVAAAESAQRGVVEEELMQLLDAPLLFVKRHSYTGIHIYDTFYKWPPGGGGIYVLENPRAPRSAWRIRPVIDPTTPGTLGVGVYTHPELSWDATKLLFCFKGEPEGNTSIYEIGLDGQGLRRLSDPSPSCGSYCGRGGGQHDLAPAYLPDGRIVCLSTRPSGLVPCNNTGVAILHVMNADGSDLRPISVNNVNEFDPSILPDGRILFGRWEYVDKNALTIQSLWTMRPDGTEETAFYANNMVFPEAILDARAVPGTPWIVGTFAKHNSTPRGSIALVDPRYGKNEPRAILNLEHPENPVHDLGDSCEPWPLAEEAFVFSGRPAGRKRNVLELMHRAGHRFVLLEDPEICLHSPMLVKARVRPPVLAPTVDRTQRTGRFLVQDIYQGLTGVPRGEVKWLRVLEETSRVSATHTGANPYNQTFLLSAALAFSVKNYLGVVPVDEEGSAYFEVPAGRALYLQALDAEGRLVQSMRTFVQAAPGATRACLGCHESKAGAPAHQNALRDLTQGRQPVRPQPESWGSGYLDYPSLVQPILDRRCVSCHGGEEGLAAGLDLTGGWTEHFNISYENLVSRRETQLVAYWIAGIDCMNGTAFWSAQLFAPRQHGSGAAPLARLLAEGHDGYLGELTRTERDALMAWIDSNGLYYGTWDYSPHGCALKDWPGTRQALVAEMQAAGCFRCHGEGNRIAYFEQDWFNLQEPTWSRLLRAPLAKGAPGLGLGLCRDRKVDPRRQRIHLLRNGYAHAVQPVDKFSRHPILPADEAGEAVVSFASVEDPHYQRMLAIIRQGRALALAAPRVDMPGAEVIAGESRMFQPPPLPERAPPLRATVGDDGVVMLVWERSAQTIGLESELHRASEPGFTPAADNLLVRTKGFQHADPSAPAGRQTYGLVLVSGTERSAAVYATVEVPALTRPSAPETVQAEPGSCAIHLQWAVSPGHAVRYHVYRRSGGATEYERLTREPTPLGFYTDSGLAGEEPQTYVVRAVNQRGLESDPTRPVTARAVVLTEPVFTLGPDSTANGRLLGEGTWPGRSHGRAVWAEGELRLSAGGHLTFAHRPEFDLQQPLSVECRVWLEAAGAMPVVVSCGGWQQAGWFLQRLGERWRWHVGGVDCDGGQPAVGRWVHLVGTYDGKAARLYVDGALAGEAVGSAKTDRWSGDLHVGQYSGGPGPDYQVMGRIAGLKIYHRPLAASEVAGAAAARVARR
ncbi:MAG: hypothetical protein FJ387_18015 [Verrucomicrobia bacterium]|nr:hypothetical protein [Verrucomicrobiota bacterium]